MQFHIRWPRIQRPNVPARVQVALMTATILAAALAGSAGKRWV
jgi:hypothetical protein